MKAKNNYHGGSKVITATDDANINRFFDDIRKYEPLSKVEEKELLKLIQKKHDKSALDKLMKANLRFVVTVAKTYQNQGVPLLDLIQEGTLGMIEAASRFDVRRDLRFYSYAVWWIKIKIITTFDFHKRLIQLPANRTLLITKVKRVINTLEAKLQRPATSEEIRKHFKGQSVTDIDEAIAFALLPISLYGQIIQKDGSEGETQLVEILEADNHLSTDQIDRKTSLQHDLNKLLYQLPQHQYDILVLALGLNEEEPHRNEKLGKIFGKREKDIITIKRHGVNILKKHKGKTDLNTYL